MSTIALPVDLELRLRQEAAANNVPLQELTLGLLAEAVENRKRQQTLRDVVGKIKRMPASPYGLRPAGGSLAEALKKAPLDPQFDLAEWQLKWSLVEAELRALAQPQDRPTDQG